MYMYTVRTVDTLSLGLSSMYREARSLGLKINWAKTKSQTLSDFLDCRESLSLNGERLPFLDRFTYLGIVISTSLTALHQTLLGT